MANFFLDPAQTFLNEDVTGFADVTSVEFSVGGEVHVIDDGKLLLWNPIGIELKGPGGRLSLVQNVYRSKGRIGAEMSDIRGLFHQKGTIASGHPISSKHTPIILCTDAQLVGCVERQFQSSKKKASYLVCQFSSLAVLYRIMSLPSNQLWSPLAW